MTAPSTNVAKEVDAGSGAGLFARAPVTDKFEVQGRFDQDRLNELLLWSMERKASDVTIQTNEVIRAEIGGVLYPIVKRQVNQSELEDIIRYIYGENGVAELKMGHDIDCAHEVKIKDVGRIRYRVNITGVRARLGISGYSITLRALPQQPPRMADLGIEEAIISAWRPKNGMILVTGPTGSGKSTLLASGIRHLFERGESEKILEYSAPVEYTYDGLVPDHCLISQSSLPQHLRPKSGEESWFAYSARNALRRKPSTIIVGEARDRETISACIELALTGHLVYSTMHTIGVAETIRRAIRAFETEDQRTAAFDMMDTLRMVVTQRLLPRVGGGLVASREFMVFDNKARARFLDTESVEEWPTLARQMMVEKRCVAQTMEESAGNLLEQDLITMDTFRFEAARKS